jgi:copper homeostasis protein CutC
MVLETVSAPDPIATYADEAMDKPAADASRLTGVKSEAHRPPTPSHGSVVGMLTSFGGIPSITFQWAVKPEESDFAYHSQATRIVSATP